MEAGPALPLPGPRAIVVLRNSSMESGAARSRQNRSHVHPETKQADVIQSIRKAKPDPRTGPACGRARPACSSPRSRCPKSATLPPHPGQPVVQPSPGAGSRRAAQTPPARALLDNPSSRGAEFPSAAGHGDPWHGAPDPNLESPFAARGSATKAGPGLAERGGSKSLSSSSLREGAARGARSSAHNGSPRALHPPVPQIHFRLRKYRNIPTPTANWIPIATQNPSRVPVWGKSTFMP